MTKKTSPDLKHYKKLLLDRQKELLDISEMSQENASPVELDQSRVGRLSRMDAMQGQAMSLEAKRRTEAELTRITSALKRIDAGDYGLCLQCEEEIVAGRLEIDPSVLLCVQCASQR
ncbi:MAG: TraR/DksA family transcriptional regulator [Acidiferrobacterales bacterium]